MITPCYAFLYTYGGTNMRFFLMVSILFLSFSSTTYADVIDPEDSGSTAEESEEGDHS